jgi:hypothetical protein
MNASSLPAKSRKREEEEKGFLRRVEELRA